MQEAGALPLYFTPEGLHGGALLGVRGSDFIAFYDWTSLQCVRRIDVSVDAVHWSPAGDMLALTLASSFYILKFSAEAFAEAVASGAQLDEDGCEAAFDVVTEVCVGTQCKHCCLWREAAVDVVTEVCRSCLHLRCCFWCEATFDVVTEVSRSLLRLRLCCCLHCACARGCVVPVPLFVLRVLVVVLPAAQRRWLRGRVRRRHRGLPLLSTPVLLLLV